MRFLVDESTGPAVAQWLQQQGHEAFSVYDEARGMDEDDIIQKAFTENWKYMLLGKSASQIVNSSLDLFHIYKAKLHLFTPVIY